jgi:hypothetical protein
MPCALLASFAQALLERGHEVCKLAGQFAAEKRNHRHRRLLRARRERARSTRALLNSQESNLSWPGHWCLSGTDPPRAIIILKPNHACCHDSAQSNRTALL